MPRQFTMTQEELKTWVAYDPETGIVTRLRHGRRVGVGSVVGSKKNGGLEARVNGNRVLVHRMIWFYMTGEWPEVIDHINRDPFDNRWCNLRNCTQAQNRCNNSLRSDNTSGTMGVRRYKANPKRWQAEITHKGRSIFLGSFDTLEEAAIARRRAAQELWGEFAPKGV